MTVIDKNEIYQKAEDIPVISPAVIQLIRIIDEPETSINEIVSTVSLDEVLCTDLFKLTNSANFANTKTIKSIHEAIHVTGILELKLLSFLLAAKRLVMDSDLWYKSVFVASTAREIAKSLGKDAIYQSNIYLAGLMHTLGELIFKLYYRDIYKDICQNHSGSNRLNKEKEIFGLDSIELTNYIAELSIVPDTVTEILKYNKRFDHPDYKQENAIIELAGILEENELVEDEDIEFIIDESFLYQYELHKIELNSQLISELHKKARGLISY